jgi:hypothetical protein
VSTKTPIAPLEGEAKRWTDRFVARLHEELGDRLRAVVNYDWIIEDFEEDETNENNVQVVVIVDGKDDEERVFDVSTEVEVENDFNVMLFPMTHHAAAVERYGIDAPWPSATALREGRVIYDSGFVAKLRGD